MAKSAPPFSCSSCWQRSGVMDFISAVVSSLSRTLVSSLRIRPCCRTTGGWPDGDVQVAGLELNDRGQQLVDQNLSAGHWWSLSEVRPTDGTHTRARRTHGMAPTSRTGIGPAALFGCRCRSMNGSKYSEEALTRNLSGQRVPYSACEVREPE